MFCTKSTRIQKYFCVLRVSEDIFVAIYLHSQSLTDSTKRSALNIIFLPSFY